MTANEELMGPVRKSIMLPRIGLSSDIANGAVFLASDEGEFITGVLLPIDGGLTCHLEMPDTVSQSALGE